MSEKLGSAVLDLTANAGPLNKTLAATRVNTIKEMAATAKGSRAAMAGMMVAVGAAVGVGLHKIGKEFEAAYNVIRDGTGATGKDLEGLKDSFRGAFARAPQDAKTTGSAIADLNTRLGLTGDELEDRATQFLHLAHLTGGDVTKSIEKVSHAFDNWNVATEDQEGYLDGLYRVSQATGIGVDDLADKVRSSGPVFRQFGFSFAESAALMGEAHKAGLDLESGLKRAFANLAAPTDTVRKEMRKLGIDVSKGPEVAFKQFIKTMESAEDPTKLAGAALELFGKRSGTDMVEAVQSGRFNLSAMVDTFENGEDTITGVYEETETLTQKLDRLKNRGMLALEKPAMAVVDALTKGADVAITLADAAANVPGPIRKIIGIAAVAAAGLGVFALAIAKVRGAFVAMRAAMMANPYALVIAATVAVAYLIVNNWDKIVGFLSKVWDTISKTATKVWDGIKKFFEKHWDKMLVIFGGPLGAIVTLIIKHWSTIRDTTVRVWNAIRDRIRTVVNAIRTFMSGAWRSIRDTASSLWGAIRDRVISPIRNAFDRVRTAVRNIATWLTERWRAIRDTASRIWGAVRDRIINPIGNAVERVRTVIGNLRTWLSETWGKILERVLGFGKSMRDRLSNTFKGAANAVIGFINRIIGAINKIPGVNIGKIKKIGAQSSASASASAAEAQALYMGGKVTKPLAIVGEEAPRHPEYVIPTNPAYRGRAIELTNQLLAELGMAAVPGYAVGGVIGKVGGAVRKVKDTIGAGIGLIKDGPGAILKLLPNPADLLPDWMQGFGKWMIDHIGGWIKDKVKSVLASLVPSGGGGGYKEGTWALANHLASKFGLTITSAYRSPADNARVGGARGSSHMKGSPENPGAHDFVPPSAPSGPGPAGLYAMNTLGAMWADNHDYGSGLHLHVSWFRKGGILDQLASGVPYVGSYGASGVLPADGLFYGHKGEHVGAPPEVHVTFADGMGWLEKFVDIRVERANRVTEQIYVAGSSA